jgi:3-deoxy-manno-octulosonate cytidylyltransferase (CMP-KDO synthetase)
MTAVGIIPVRYNATRFPGKPLTPIAGIPLIRRVWEGARQSKRLRTILVATDDERIAAACREFGIEVAMTSAKHTTGTDRIAEVAAGLEDEIVVNIQGDEPLIEGWVIDAAVDAILEDPEVSASTVVHAVNADNIDDPNRVKVVLDRKNNALYFSRSPIPALRDAKSPAQARPKYWQHVGLYAFRRSLVLDFPRMEPTPAERSEKLEQLRLLENGYSIRCAVIEGWQSLSVDAPADVARVEAVLQEQERR